MERGPTGRVLDNPGTPIPSNCAPASPGRAGNQNGRAGQPSRPHPPEHAL